MTVSFNSSAYRWNGNQLQSADGGIIYADLTAIFNAGTLRDRDEVVSIGGTDMTVQEVLDNIAAAYGYEGSTEEFLNLFVYDETNGTTPVSVEQMLANMVQGTGTDMFPSTEDSFEADGRFFDGTTITFDGNTGNFAGIGGAATQTTAVLGLSALGGNFSDITVDFSNVSMVDNKGTSTVSATSGDEDGLGAGRRLGDMIGVSIQNNGMIYASYDNGMTKLLGQIATAEFANASGLEKQGDNLYSASLNSGEFDGIGVDITANGGYMSTGQLEMSNVDLSSEFTEMITTQRGFQANSRIITVSDTLLEELTNLKR